MGGAAGVEAAVPLTQQQTPPSAPRRAPVSKSTRPPAPAAAAPAAARAATGASRRGAPRVPSPPLFGGQSTIWGLYGFLRPRRDRGPEDMEE